MADSNLMALRYLEEVTWGTTPASALKTLRFTAASINNVSDTAESQEVITDRQLRDLLLNGKSAQGQVGFELSYSTYDEILEGLLASDWVIDTGFSGALVGTDLLENGAVKKSYSFEKQFTDLTNEFYGFKGCRIGTGTLTLALNQPVQGTFTLIGKQAIPAGTTIGTGAPVAATTTLPIKMTNITAVTEGGSGLTGVVGLTLNIDNGLRAQQELGNVALFGVGYGGFRLSGNLDVYYATRTLLQKATDFTVSSLGFTLTDDAGNVYVAQIPSVRYGNATVANEGPNGDILLRMPYTAKLDPTTLKTLRITRNPI